MFSFKSFLNFLGRNSLYTAINIFGFAGSLAFVVLIGLYVQKELAVDGWHSKSDRIFVLANDNSCSWAAKIADDISARYPEIEATVRLNVERKPIKTEAQQQGVYKNVMMTDSTFFTVLDWQFIEGSQDAALNDMQSVVLSQRFANETFPGVSAVGKTIEIEEHSYTVTGVIKDIKNSLIRSADVFVRFEVVAYDWSGYLTSYNSFNFPILVLVKPGADLQPKLADMAAYFKSYTWMFQREVAKQVSLVSMHDAYWGQIDGWKFNGNSPRFVGILAFCALAILLFAVINYVNLSVAQTSFRAKQAATRRLLGGTKTQLFGSFIAESTILCAVSLLLGITIASGLTSWFSSTMQSTIALEALLTPVNLAIMVISVVLLGFISGMIPAYIITRFKPIAVVTGDFRRKSKMVLSKVLIGVQYIITIVLIGCAITITRQTSYLINADLGFNRDAAMTFDNVLDDVQSNSIAGILGAVPGVEMVSLSQGTPTDGGNNNSFDYEGVNYSFSVFMADSLFMPLLGIDIVSQTGVIDSGAMWINQTGARTMNIKPTDVQFPFNGRMVPLKGVVKDFNTGSMKEQIGDVVIGNMYNDYPWNILVKLSPTCDLAATRAAVEAAYSEAAGVVCQGQFMDEQVERWYVEQKQTRALVGVISLLAIIISALGVLAMSIYFIRQRTNEIAVRKVFGSSNGSIFAKLIKQFVVIILIAFVVSVPIIYYFMDGWLVDFVYRINLSYDIYILAGISAAAIAIATISWQAIKAMNANPVKSLKSE